MDNLLKDISEAQNVELSSTSSQTRNLKLHSITVVRVNHMNCFRDQIAEIRQASHRSSHAIRKTFPPLQQLEHDGKSSNTIFKRIILNFGLDMSTITTVGGRWVPRTHPIKLSLLRGKSKSKIFKSVMSGPHTLLILADVGLKDEHGAATFDPKKRVTFAISLFDKHSALIAKDTVESDASTPFVSFSFKLTPEQSPGKLEVEMRGHKVSWLKSTKIFLRIVDGDLIRSETDMSVAAKRLAIDFPYLVRSGSKFREKLRLSVTLTTWAHLIDLGYTRYN